jgi:hypothetical protein
MNRNQFLDSVAAKKHEISEEQRHLSYHLETCTECEPASKGHRCQQGRKMWSAVEIKKGELTGLVKKVGKRFI